MRLPLNHGSDAGSCSQREVWHRAPLAAVRSPLCHPC